MKAGKILGLVLIIVFLAGCGLFRTGPNDYKSFSYEIIHGVDTIFEGDTWEDAGVRFILEGEAELVYAEEDTVDVQKFGIYTVVYEHQVDGETLTVNREVTVLPPIVYGIPLEPGVDTIEAGNDWEDAGIDESYMHESFDVEVFSDVETDTPGDYTVEYHIKDFFGNIHIVTRHVTVLP